MKNKGLKITLIVLLSIVALALIAVMIFAILNKSLDLKVSLIRFGDNTEMIFQNEYDPEQFENINIDVSSSNVRIEKGNTDKIKVTAYGDKDDRIAENISENELLISKESSKIYIFTFLYWCNEEIIIEIPDDCTKNFTINTSSGDITAPNLETSNLKFETSSGKITCGNINNGELNSSSGDIKVGDGNELTINTSSGEIQTGNLKLLNASASSGDIEVGTIEETNLKTSSGKITVNSSNRIQAECSSGDIRINNIRNYCSLKSTSGNIEINTLNITENSSIEAKSGNVRINSKNDIYVETQTGSGDADVENNNRKAEIVLNITTTSGNIDVK